jgi:DNA modification methylase
MIKIINGDAFKELTSMEPNSIDSIITDPPYGVLNGNVIDKNKRGFNTRFDGHCDWDKIDDIVEFSERWLKLCMQLLKNDSFLFVFWSQKLLKEGYEIFNPNRLVFWRYNNLVIGGNGDFAWDYNPIFVIRKGNPKLIPGKWSCDMEFTKPQSNFKSDTLVHPTQKPLKLIEHLISISTQPGNIILDPFAGSGTTGIAAENLERQSILIEQNSEYISKIKDRMPRKDDILEF